jgi:beta-galactosidase
MKILFFVLGLFTTFLVSAQTKSDRTRLFDTDWRFLKDSLVHAEMSGFDDKSWRKLDLPHDWSIEDLPNQSPGEIQGPFSKASAGGTSTGYTVGGTGWYRKSFSVSTAEKNKNISIHFEGAYMETDVWLNGHHLGYHPNGYTPFDYNLTRFLMPAGKDNVLAVRVKNTGRNSRWYTGSGIYRHVWLTFTETLQIAPMGISVTTPTISDKQAQVQVTTAIIRSSDKNVPVTVESTLISPDGKIIGHNNKLIPVLSEKKIEAKQVLTVAKPQKWSPETPFLYKVKVVLISGKNRLDSLTTSFGIRSISFDAKQGFVLNGKRVLLKGGCVHHDNGPLGAAAIDRAEERKVELLKANGFNAVRTSHNPPSKAFLNACDRLGLLVIDEAFDMWQKPKTPQDYHQFFDKFWKQDLEAMIVRDRNHPSVILWSIGNEINERAELSGLEITKNLVDLVHKLDPTRPATEALCVFWEHPEKTWKDADPAFAMLDVGGYNYEWKNYEPDHKRVPERVMLGTETFAKEALENWNMVEKHPYIIGDFVWTAMDYMGETAIGHTLYQPIAEKDSTKAVLPWPWFNAWCGDLDLTGFKKPQSYYRDIVWRNRAVAMAVHSPVPDGMKETVTNWGWPDEHQSWSWAGAEGKPLQVRVFTRSNLVRLELNGKLVGEQQIPDSTVTANFTVPYQPGVLKATSFDDGKPTGSVELITAGKPFRLRLTADRQTIKADRNDLSYVTVEVLDEAGHVVPSAVIPVSFELSGAGILAGLGNGNPTDLSSFQSIQKSTFNGRCLAIIRPEGNAGTIKLKATAPGLKVAELVITAR